MYIKMRGGIGINIRPIRNKKASEIIPDSWNYHNIFGWLPYIYGLFYYFNYIEIVLIYKYNLWVYWFYLIRILTITY